MIKDFKNDLEKLGNRVQLITQQSDLDKDFNLGIILHIESARTLKNPLIQIQELYDLGIRGVIPMHFKDNHLGNSCDDLLRRTGFKRRDHGLTDIGERFIEKCNEMKIWLDLTHTSDQTALDILESANEVMVSHIGIRDLRKYDRNKTIHFYKKLVNKKGVIGITPWTHLIGKEKHQYLLNMKTLLSEGIEEAVCIGTDYGAPINTHKDFKSSLDLGHEINDQMIKPENILWNNAFNFFKRALPQ